MFLRAFNIHPYFLVRSLHPATMDVCTLLGVHQSQIPSLPQQRPLFKEETTRGIMSSHDTVAEPPLKSTYRSTTKKKFLLVCFWFHLKPCATTAKPQEKRTTPQSLCSTTERQQHLQQQIDQENTRRLIEESLYNGKFRTH